MVKNIKQILLIFLIFLMYNTGSGQTVESLEKDIKKQGNHDKSGIIITDTNQSERDTYQDISESD